MDQQQFAAFYKKAQEHRSRLWRNTLLEKFFKTEQGESPCYPPVLGFGLPQDGRPVPVVTIALNASNGEFPSHLSMEDKAQAQWDAQSSRYFMNPYRDWWSLAGDMLWAATAQRVTYTGPRETAAHVDFTGIVTAGGLDSAYGECDELARKDVRAWLRESLSGTFMEVLASLVQQNGTKAALVFGYAPAFPASTGRLGKNGPSGSRTLKDAFSYENNVVNFVGDGGEPGEGGQPTVAWGRITGRSVPADLQNLPFFFVSQGPSSLRKASRSDAVRSAPLIAAAAKLAPHLVDVLGPVSAPPPAFRIRRKGASHPTG